MPAPNTTPKTATSIFVGCAFDVRALFFRGFAVCDLSDCAFDVRASAVCGFATCVFVIRALVGCTLGICVLVVFTFSIFASVARAFTVCAFAKSVCSLFLLLPIMNWIIHLEAVEDIKRSQASVS